MGLAPTGMTATGLLPDQAAAAAAAKQLMLMGVGD